MDITQKIITISSVNALLDQSNEFAYSTAKNSIIHFSKILARDLLKYNIQVNCICPGPTVTSRFLHTLKQRKKMSKKVSPLFITRGVPGTHDTILLLKCLKNLKTSNFRKFLIPKFDKSIDDRLPKSQWQKVLKKPDIVIFEGWCVGVKPQKKKDLIKPVNTLEKDKDKKRKWRTKVNEELKKKYNRLFKFIDINIFLKVPSFKHVFKWRLLQEKKLKLTSKGKKIMNKNQVKEFVMFYERLTKHMLRSFNKTAECIIKIDEKHKLKSIKFN